MKKIVLIIALTSIIINIYADKYAGEIFRMGAGVENFGLGNTGLTNTGTAALAYWNPAFIDRNSSNHFELMHAEEYAGLLAYDIIAFTYQNKFSMVLTRIGIDNIPLTAWDDNANRPYVYKNVNNSDIALFMGFSRSMMGLNMGFTPKLAYSNLADESGFGFGLDISSYYLISENWISAAKIKDIFTTQIIWSTGTRETVLPSLGLETSYKFNIPAVNKSSEIILATDIYSEDRDFAATNDFGIFSTDYHVGLKTNLHDRADLLLGYDVDNLTTGIKLNFHNWIVNYGFKYNTELENSHRISVELKI